MNPEWFSQYVTSVPARGVLIARHLGQSIVMSMLAGCFGGWIGANLLTASVGPIVPYLICSSVGFIVSSINFWTSEKSRALELKRLYPKVLQHHVLTSFRGMGLSETLKFENNVNDKDLTIPQISWYIMAAQASQSTLEEIDMKNASALVEQVTEANNRD